MRRAPLGRVQPATTDVIVIGAGAAGLSAALALAPRRVTVLTKARLGDGGASPRAQGGIAAAIGPSDAPSLHARDTLEAGAGICDVAAVEMLTGGGPSAIRRLIDLGTRFDRNHDGTLAVGREAAHGRHRILHADGDATGREIVRALTAAVRLASHVRVEEECFAEDLLVTNGRVAGVIARTHGRRVVHRARTVVLATGGSGRVYRDTTNPIEATGDGLAMAARAGAILADLEFVQFHPTALDVAADPLPLVTEALRGQGAILVDDLGRRFMQDAHPAAELAPRDIVARAMWRHRESGRRILLDARTAVGADFPTRFPTVFDLCHQHGIDPRHDQIPVTPAAHYHMGGVATDGRGRSSLPGLWVCGETACSGVHGANRLASNSLLEAVVFGGRVASDVADALNILWHSPAIEAAALDALVQGESFATWQADDGEVERLIRSTMWADVGLVRTEQGLRAALATFTGAARTAGSGETRNLLLAARLIATAALARTESRGGHFRLDFSVPLAEWQRRQYVHMLPDGCIAGTPHFTAFELSTARPARSGAA